MMRKDFKNTIELWSNGFYGSVYIFLIDQNSFISNIEITRKKSYRNLDLYLLEKVKVPSCSVTSRAGLMNQCLLDLRTREQIDGRTDSYRKTCARARLKKNNNNNCIKTLKISLESPFVFLRSLYPRQI